MTDTETSIVTIRNVDPDTDFGFIGQELLPTEGAIPTTPMGATGSAFAANGANPCDRRPGMANGWAPGPRPNRLAINAKRGG
ncbi:MAG TPA: hypothetical protein VHG53_06815 [Candidatus Limnocylindria bacterium]|nr:hypothetical protein [Candidatus Limnocylindria bacterium]